MKVRDAINMFEKDGWYLVVTKGSYRQYLHPTKPGCITITGQLSDDLASGRFNYIIKQSQLKKIKNWKR